MIAHPVFTLLPAPIVFLLRDSRTALVIYLDSFLEDNVPFIYV